MSTESEKEVWKHFDEAFERMDSAFERMNTAFAEADKAKRNQPAEERAEQVKGDSTTLVRFSASSGKERWHLFNKFIKMAVSVAWNGRATLSFRCK